MTKTSKTLKLIFKNDHHKVSTLSLPYASVNLTEAEVKEVMDTIAKKIFLLKKGLGYILNRKQLNMLSERLIRFSLLLNQSIQLLQQLIKILNN